MNAKQELVKNWLYKAQRDLASAQQLASGPEPYLDTAVYHCQQAAEKAIKGWLTYHDQRFEKTHDIRMLVGLASTIDTTFDDWFEVAELLTPYATAYRYPGEVLAPSQVEFADALQSAQKLFEFILSLLPEDYHP